MSRLLKLRVSDLDAWVGFVEPKIPEFEISTETFINRMMRKEPPTLAMKAGSALHELLEDAKPGEEWGSLDGVPRGGFRFRFDMDADLELPVRREPRIVEKVFQTSVGPVVLRGRIDGEDRIERIIDYKLTEGFDAERYGSSLQWPAYLLMEGKRAFRYVIFEGKVKEDKDGQKNVYIHNVHHMDYWAYPEMEREVQRRVDELAEFVSRVPALVEKLTDPRSAEDLTADED